MTSLIINEKNIEIDFGTKKNGDYGVHDGFFNAIAIIDNKEYGFQCCAEDDRAIDFADCGHDWGMCGDVNEKIALTIGWENMVNLLEAAYTQYSH